MYDINIINYNNQHYTCKNIQIQGIEHFKIYN